MVITITSLAMISAIGGTVLIVDWLAVGTITLVDEAKIIFQVVSIVARLAPVCSVLQAF